MNRTEEVEVLKEKWVGSPSPRIGEEKRAAGAQAEKDPQQGHRGKEEVMGTDAKPEGPFAEWS